jgi:TRAP-type C4-dicarboxylate transport system permease small subunit
MLDQKIAKPKEATKKIISLLDFAGLGFLICVFIMGIEVISRYLFNSPQIWVQDAVVMLVGSCFAIGGAVSLLEGKHIRIVAIYDIMSPRVKLWLDMLSYLIALAYLIPVGFGAYVNVRLSLKVHETTGTSWDSPLPMVLKTVLFISLVIMTLTALTKLWSLVRNLKR